MDSTCLSSTVPRAPLSTAFFVSVPVVRECASRLAWTRPRGCWTSSPAARRYAATQASRRVGPVQDPVNPYPTARELTVEAFVELTHNIGLSRYTKKTTTFCQKRRRISKRVESQPNIKVK